LGVVVQFVHCGELKTIIFEEKLEGEERRIVFTDPEDEDEQYPASDFDAVAENNGWCAIDVLRLERIS
jgi:hypothetical protein